jgi:hypothetical protein
MTSATVKLLDSKLLHAALVGKTVSASVWGDLEKFWSRDAERAPAPIRPERREPVRQRRRPDIHRPARVESWSPSSNWGQDKSTLCMCLCLSENTVDTWVHQGLLPPSRKRGGKLMWKWSEVEKYLEGYDPQCPEELAERIRHATRKASSK